MKPRILCYGDSNTWGWVPGSDGERFAPDVRWPGVMQAQLGDGYVVIEEAQNGRTTMWDDPGQLVCKNGLKHLPVVLESQKPIDLVILMLGVNDLKNHFGLDAYAIAHGCGVLLDRILASDAGPGKQAPKALLVAPALVTEGPCPFGHLFDDGPEKSAGLAEAYREIAVGRGVPFFDAASVASCPIPDAIHIDAESCGRLGRALAELVLQSLPSEDR